MQELGYVYNMGAARLRADRSLTMRVVVRNLINPFFSELLAGIETVIDAAGMVVILVNSGDLLSRQETLLTRMREHGVDGIILCPAAGTDLSLVDRMVEWNCLWFRSCGVFGMTVIMPASITGSECIRP